MYNIQILCIHIMRLCICVHIPIHIIAAQNQLQIYFDIVKYSIYLNYFAQYPKV